MHFRKRSNNHSWLIFDIHDDNTKRKLALVHDDGGLEPRIEWCHATEDEKPTVQKLAEKIWTTRRKSIIPVEQNKDPQTVEEASVPETQKVAVADTPEIPPQADTEQPVGVSNAPDAATDHEAPSEERMDGVPVSATGVEEQPSDINLESAVEAEPVKIDVESAAHEADADTLTLQEPESASPLKVGIFCEGETEQRYIRYLAKFLEVQDKVDVQVTTNKDPGVVFKSLASQFLWDRQVGEEKYSEIWLVYDRDSHSQFDYAVEMAPKFPFMHLAFTNPSIEYWFLLHFETFNGVLPLDHEIVISRERREEMIGARTKRVFIDEVIEMTTSNETCLNLLKQHCHGYEKNSDKCFPLLRLNTLTACRRARQLENPAVGQGSSMPDLIDRLCRLTGLPLEEARNRLVQKELTPEQADLELGYFRRSLNRLGQTALAMTTLGKQQKKLENAMAGNIEKPFAFCKRWLAAQIPETELPALPGNRDAQLATLPYIQAIGGHFSGKSGRPKDPKVLARLYQAIASLEAQVQHLAQENGNNNQAAPTGE
ncbi:MAG: RloB domain-containing protein [Sutterella sp.]|nr:RloB domain-containing protein [Sutterella sp.]